jgi:Wax ester synthase-like Acyl-CoA acyltransferase domain
LAYAPLNLGAPAWVDAEDFDFDRHIRPTGLPAGASVAYFRAHVGRGAGRRDAAIVS